ncbi:ribonuclease domain-containing protein [Nocardioides sp.]|uniref:ribonuclease domain-containing protein n=1 Tax=Nocardioides sp. TaxID=35761 RepID=UPI003D0F1BC4
MSTSQRRALAGVALALAVAVLTWWVQGNDSSNTEADTRTTPSIVAAASPTADGDSRLGTMSVGELPAEGQDMLDLIDQGGPFPGSRDGVTFENREGILPDHERAYYHEYTVPTPGSNDRGARRIVVGDSGEFYYTDDHYDSFRRIAR